MALRVSYVYQDTLLLDMPHFGVTPLRRIGYIPLNTNETEGFLCILIDSAFRNAHTPWTRGPCGAILVLLETSPVAAAIPIMRRSAGSAPRLGRWKRPTLVFRHVGSGFGADQRGSIERPNYHPCQTVT